MGSSQSARKLTIANEEDDVNVITISEAVAKRLAESASQQPAVIAQKVTTASVATATTVAAAVPARASLPPQQLAEGYPQYTMSALAMQQKKNTELAEQETYWKQRMQNLEKTHEKINRAIDDEYKKALTIFDDCRGEDCGWVLLWWFLGARAEGLRGIY